MKRIVTVLFAAFAVLLVSSCGRAEPTLADILYQFNWMGDQAYSEKAFANKPFLRSNQDGSSAGAGVLDVNRDGVPEIMLMSTHPPRGIPVVEVFAVSGAANGAANGIELQSMGGFFASKYGPLSLSYYRDSGGNLLFLQEVSSDYGGTVKTLVATYAEGLQSFPIASVCSHYGAEPRLYYVFPDGADMTCDSLFLSGAFDGAYSTTEEVYRARIADFMDTLTWVEDVPYDYCIYYHLHNSFDSNREVRFDEILEGVSASSAKDFETPEEMKKTNDMVAEALAKAYCAALAEG